ncbi:MAG: hypothetical protein CL609_18385 [Anaerolineaceae bacterium]|nr:hypothetical protein [Anaerolineaceae bacterium]
MSAEENTSINSNWEQFKKEGLSLLNSLGKVIDQAANDLSKLTVVSLEEEDRQRLDQLVGAGVVENRSAAARYLIGEGARTRKDLFEKIERTNAEIKNLKENLGVIFASKQVK